MAIQDSLESSIIAQVCSVAVVSILGKIIFEMLF